MENAVDALKMAFAIFVFAIAITLALSVVGQARSTSEIVFSLNDKTLDYEYTTADDYNAKEQRIVGFETILPTIYRYAKEQYAVTIFNKSGEPIVRYDLYTEGFMGNWNTILKNRNSTNDQIKKEANTTYDNVNDRFTIIERLVKKETGNDIKLIDKLPNLYEGESSVNNITIVSPWMGDPNNDVLDRIRCDLTNDGTYTKNNITYKGKNLINYKNSKFKEFFIELYTSGETVTSDDGNYSIETIKGNKKLEIIYILTD